jgi:hypothetical protein
MLALSERTLQRNWEKARIYLHPWITRHLPTDRYRSIAIECGRTDHRGRRHPRPSPAGRIPSRFVL